MATAQSIRAGAAYVELFSQDSKLQRGLKRAQAKLRAFASSVQSLGQKLVAVGTVAATPFALSAKSYADFEQAMARVLALTQAAPADFQRLQDEARKLGETTAFSATQAAEAMGFFAQSGFTVEEILKATRPALDLAATGQIELAEAADITTKILRGMGISTEELSHTVDVLAKAMTTANTDLSMLGEAFKFVGPIAKTAGVRFEEITAAIQVLSDAGQGGEMAGTMLRGMILSLSAPSREAEQELNRLGISVEDQQGNFRSLADIIRDLEKAMSGMGSRQRLKSLGIIFPARQAGGAAEFVATGAQKIIDRMEELGDASGHAGKVAATQMNTLKGAVLILKSALEGLSITIGEALAPVLREWGSVILTVIGGISEWAKKNRQLFQTIAKTLLAVVVIGSAMIAFGLAIKVVVFALGGIGAALGLIGGLISALLSPIGLVTAAIAGIGIWFLRSTETGQRAMSAMSDSLKKMADFFGKTWQGIVDAVRAGDLALAGKIAWSALKVIWQKGVLWLEDRWLGFKNFFIDVFHKAVFGIARFLNDAWSNIQIAWAETIAFLQKTWTKFTKGVELGFERVTSRFQLGQELLANANATPEQIVEIINRRKAENKAREQEIIRQGKAELANIEAGRERRREEIEADRAGIQQQLNQAQAREKAERDALRKKAIADSEKALADAIKEWQAAVDEAARLRAQKGVEDAAEGLRQAKAEESFSGLGQTVDKAVAKADVQGTFNIAALPGLGGETVREKELDKLEDIDNKLGKLVRKAQGGGLVFA